MRLICPGCGAQYEVDAALIPAEGRDVECSACGEIWFEAPADAGGAQPADAPAAEAGAEAVSEAGPEAGPEAPVRAPRRSVTPEIAEILRAEAERERAARAAEAQAALATQEELPLPPAGDRPAVAAPAAASGPAPDGGRAGDDLAELLRRIVEEETAGQAGEPPQAGAAASVDVPQATVRPVEPPPEPAPVLPQASRRDRLPDIEEISSTLNPAAAPLTPAHEGTPAAPGRSFRLGFALVLLVAAALGLVYANAARIIAALPAAEPVIAPYAAAVDDGRLWLDAQLQRALEALGSGADPAE